MVNAVLDIEFNLHNKVKFQPELILIQALHGFRISHHSILHC